MQTVAEAPITKEEMQQLFGETIPMEAVALVWNEPGETTIGQIRAKLREIAANRREPTLPERLRKEAQAWGMATNIQTGPALARLLCEAADEIERLARSAGEITG